MGFLAVLAVAGAALGIIGAVSSYNQKQDEIDYQKQQSYLTAAEKNIGDLNSYLGQLEIGYDLSSYLDDIDSLQSLITSDQEYVSIYENILNGDRTGSEEARNLAVLENNISITDSNIEAYLRQQQLAETNAQNYLKKASLDKKDAVETGVSTYTDMMKQRSISNVMASSSGAIKSSYSSAALRQENEMMNYIGVDMKFNTGVEGGSFVDKYILLENQITAQINANNENIRLLGESKLQAEMEKTRAQGDLDTQLEKLESEYNRVTGDNGSIASNQRAIERQRQNMEIAKSNLNLWKSNAIKSLESYRENAKNAGMSDADIKNELNAIKNKYKDTDVSEELKSMLDEIFA